MPRGKRSREGQLVTMNLRLFLAALRSRFHRPSKELLQRAESRLVVTRIESPPIKPEQPLNERG
jgi:hypothetical protein